MSKTTFEANRILDFLFGGGSYSPAATLYIALFTAMPTVAGGGTEVTGGSYARAAVTNNSTNFPAATGRTKSNALAITFAQATASWGTIVGAAIMDALTGGNMLDFAALDAPKVVANGDTFSLPIGSLRLTES
jgi:hypothetical protein